MIFKVRCSAIGQIMTNPRSKSETLLETAKTYVETWYKEQLYGRKKDFSNKYTDKGIIMEDSAIDFIAEQLDFGMLIKNEQPFQDEHMTGTPDILTDTLVLDVKNSWDCFTFPTFETEIPNKDYDWQLQGYMALTGKPSALLVYVLSDTPEHTVEAEAAWRYKQQNGTYEYDMEFYEKVKAQHTYSNLPAHLRIKSFPVVRDEQKIKLIRERVELCREHLKTIKITEKK